METVGTPTLLFRFPNKDRFHLTSALNASKIRAKAASSKSSSQLKGRKCPLPEATRHWAPKDTLSN